MSLYLRLWHGRRNPEEKLDGWGTDGPTLGPFESIGGTYCADLKAFSDDGDEVWFTFHEDLLFYDGLFYGDWSISHNGKGAVKASQDKADMPKDLGVWQFINCPECEREARDIDRKCASCGHQLQEEEECPS